MQETHTHTFLSSPYHTFTLFMPPFLLHRHSLFPSLSLALPSPSLTQSFYISPSLTDLFLLSLLLYLSPLLTRSAAMRSIGLSWFARGVFIASKHVPLTCLLNAVNLSHRSGIQEPPMLQNGLLGFRVHSKHV